MMTFKQFYLLTSKTPNNPVKEPTRFQVPKARYQGSCYSSGNPRRQEN